MFSTVGLKNHCPAPGTPVEAVWGGFRGEMLCMRGRREGFPALKSRARTLFIGWAGEGSRAC